MANSWPIRQFQPGTNSEFEQLGLCDSAISQIDVHLGARDVPEGASRQDPKNWNYEKENMW